MTDRERKTITADGPCPSCGGRECEEAAENPAHTVNTGAEVFTSRIRNVLCRACGLIYNDPMPSSAALTALYRAMARDVSDRPAGVSGRIMPIERNQAAFVRGYVPDAPSPRVLDIGCSMGGFLAALAEAGARTVGVEPSPHDAAVAREQFGLDVRPGFFEEIEFGSERFDLISLRFVFEHVSGPRALVRRARRLLADGGLLFIDVPNLAMPFVGLDDFFSFGHLQTFTVETLSHLCALEGLLPVAVEENRNLFESSPHPPSIRALYAWPAGARDAGKGRPEGDPRRPEGRHSTEPSRSDRDDTAAAAPPDVGAVRTLIERYRTARASLVAAVQGRLREALAGRRRVVVYGAGTHTAELWRVCPWMAGPTVAMVDGNPRLQGHTFLGVPVLSPRDLPSLAPDLIVISVRTAEPQIAAWLSEQGLGSITLRLYEHAGVAAA
jgi:2-polyprenyl-3-methyl-5-hydroxy-6-metoxy-1,4-benzoquinol methylase